MIVLENIGIWIEKYRSKHVILGGDLNVELDDSSVVSTLIRDFAAVNELSRCDHFFQVHTRVLITMRV